MSGSTDQNVFDIQQGVAIGTWVRRHRRLHASRLFHGTIVGSRREKYDKLLRHTIAENSITEVLPAPPFYVFAPQTRSLRDEFAADISVQDMFRISTMGVTTGRDQLTVSFSSADAVA